MGVANKNLHLKSPKEKENSLDLKNFPSNKQHTNRKIF